MVLAVVAAGVNAALAEEVLMGDSLEMVLAVMEGGEVLVVVVDIVLLKELMLRELCDFLDEPLTEALAFLASCWFLEAFKLGFFLERA